MKKIIVILFTVSAFIFASITPSFAIKKREYIMEMALGADTPFSKGDNYLSPILYGSFMHYFDSINSYGEIGATTTTAYLKYGFDNDSFHAGIKPIFAHTVYGSFRCFDQGWNDLSRVLAGYYGGAEFFFKKDLVKNISTEIKYLPSYYFYKKQSDDTTINLPNDHFENSGTVSLTFKNIKEKGLLGIIQHGIKIKAKYQIQKRNGYGTFDEGNGTETSDIDLTNKLYMDFGAYYNLTNDINIKFDVRAAYHFNVDRNNAESIGFIHADHAAIPGVADGEFFHHAYVASSINIGIPVGFWDTRIEPGFYVLYMPEENKVIGMQNYPKQLYKTLSLGISTKLGNMIPCFINYGYGLDAERKSSQNGEVHKGNHEVSFVLVMAFGKNESVKKSEPENKTETK